MYTIVYVCIQLTHTYERVFNLTLKEELMNYWNVTELKKFASDLKIPNRSKMNRVELITAIDIALAEK